MTNEERQILLKDLLSRQLYTPIVNIKGIKGYDRKLVSLHRSKTTSEFDVLVNSDKDEEYLPHTYSIDEIKPYLRPMSSMTEKELEELKEEHVKDERLFAECLKKVVEGDTSMRGKVVPHFANDWCNANHFDHRGLIPMGLAIEAKEGMYNFK